MRHPIEIISCRKVNIINSYIAHCADVRAYRNSILKYKFVLTSLIEEMGYRLAGESKAELSAQYYTIKKKMNSNAS